MTSKLCFLGSCPPYGAIHLAVCAYRVRGHNFAIHPLISRFFFATKCMSCIALKFFAHFPAILSNVAHFLAYKTEESTCRVESVHKKCVLCWDRGDQFTATLFAKVWTEAQTFSSVRQSMANTSDSTSPPVSGTRKFVSDG